MHFVLVKTGGRKFRCIDCEVPDPPVTGAVMSMPESQRLLDSDCPYCLLRREIIAVKFWLFKPCTALFVCPSCGSTFADVDGPSNISDRSRQLKAYLLLRWKRSNIVSLA
jgi:hypothetical protein